MKKSGIVLLIVFIILAYACNRQQEASSGTAGSATISTEDFTGVKKFYEGELLKKEITYLNGVKEGLCNNYYDDGRLKRTIWYENDIREDTAKWYYAEGMLYRATPYNNDKIDGIQTKYYKSGRVLAKIPFRHGLRTPGLIEYYENGLEVGNIPSIEIHNISTRKYESEGIVTVTLVLSNKSTNVKYFHGGIVDGAFDESKAKDITASGGMAYIELSKTPSGGRGFIDVAALYTTRFRNQEVIIKRIKLPYNDLL